MPKQTRKLLALVGMAIYGIIGAIFGSIFGLFLWGRSEWGLSSSYVPGVVIVLFCVLIFGVLGAACGRNQRSAKDVMLDIADFDLAFYALALKLFAAVVFISALVVVFRKMIS